MYLDKKEYQTINLTSEKADDEDPYQNDILFLLGTTMVIETILMIFLFSVISLIMTTVVFWFISVTWKFCKTKMFSDGSEEEEEERLELDDPPSYSTLELQEADYPPPEYHSLHSLMRLKPTSEGKESPIKKRLLFERQSRLFRSLD